MAIDAGISILLARKLGLWNRLLAAPIGINTLILARGISIFATLVMVMLGGAWMFSFMFPALLRHGGFVRYSR